jgi:hypothetical protein
MLLAYIDYYSSHHEYGITVTASAAQWRLQQTTQHRPNSGKNLLAIGCNAFQQSFNAVPLDIQRCFLTY